MSLESFEQAFEDFVKKYAALLTGLEDAETVEKVKIFALYSHINKTMPALAKHWITDNPEAKEHIRQIFEDIQKLNKERQAKK